MHLLLALFVITVGMALLAYWCLSYLPFIPPLVPWAVIFLIFLLLFACMIPAWWKRPARAALKARERPPLK